VGSNVPDEPSPHCRPGIAHLPQTFGDTVHSESIKLHSLALLNLADPPEVHGCPSDGEFAAVFSVSSSIVIISSQQGWAALCS
jgi:hypothetical protein